MLSSLAYAGNGVDPKHIQYRDWSGKRPNVMTIVSGDIGTNVPLIVFSYNVAWYGNDKQQVPHMQKQLCDLVNRSMGDKCSGYEKPTVEVFEAYFGDAKDFKPSHVDSEAYLGAQAFSKVPPGAKRIALIRVGKSQRIVRSVAAIAFDDISDDDLRQIAFEDGVLRVLKYRED
jgi:hypothetical protein